MLLYKSLYCHGPDYVYEFFNFEDSIENVRDSGVNLSLPRFSVEFFHSLKLLTSGTHLNLSLGGKIFPSL